MLCRGYLFTLGGAGTGISTDKVVGRGTGTGTGEGGGIVITVVP